MKSLLSGTSVEYGDARLKLLTINTHSKKDFEHDILHCHKYYELHLALSGSYTYKIDDKEIVLSKNQLLILPPNVPHVSVSSKYEDYSFNCISLHISKCEGKSGFFSYFHNSLETHSCKPISISYSLIKQINALKELGTNQNIVRDICMSKICVSNLVYELFNDLDGFSLVSGYFSSDDMDAEERLVLLEEMINSGYSVKSISEALGYSTRHTSRLIKEIYGCSLLQLRKKQLISKSK